MMSKAKNLVCLFSLLPCCLFAEPAVTNAPNTTTANAAAVAKEDDGGDVRIDANGGVAVTVPLSGQDPDFTQKSSSVITTSSAAVPASAIAAANTPTDAMSLLLIQEQQILVARQTEADAKMSRMLQEEEQLTRMKQALLETDQAEDRARQEEEKLQLLKQDLATALSTKLATNTASSSAATTIAAASSPVPLMPSVQEDDAVLTANTRVVAKHTQNASAPVVPPVDVPSLEQNGEESNVNLLQTSSVGRAAAAGLGYMTILRYCALGLCGILSVFAGLYMVSRFCVPQENGESKPIYFSHLFRNIFSKCNKRSNDKYTDVSIGPMQLGRHFWSGKGDWQIQQMFIEICSDRNPIIQTRMRTVSPGNAVTFSDRISLKVAASDSDLILRIKAKKTLGADEIGAVFVSCDDVLEMAEHTTKSELLLIRPNSSSFEALTTPLGNMSVRFQLVNSSSPDIEESTYVGAKWGRISPSRESTKAESVASDYDLASRMHVGGKRSDLNIRF